MRRRNEVVAEVDQRIVVPPTHPTLDPVLPPFRNQVLPLRIDPIRTGDHPPTPALDLAPVLVHHLARKTHLDVARLRLDDDNNGIDRLLVRDPVRGLVREIEATIAEATIVETTPEMIDGTVGVGMLDSEIGMIRRTWTRSRESMHRSRRKKRKRLMDRSLLRNGTTMPIRR